MTAQPRSLRRTLLVGILVPVLGFVAVNTGVLYRQALASADTAYDRTLLATAKAIGELLSIERRDGQTRLRADVPYAALEAFEADNRSRLFFRVSDADGAMVSGFDDLPIARTELPARSVYAALVHFYDDRYRGEPVRMAVLLQPVASVEGQAMATVQVAETLELRQTLARQMLVDTLWRQAALLALIVAAVWWVVQRATQPVRALSREMVDRAPGDLSPLDGAGAPRELQPLVEAGNQVMARLARLRAHQQRFVRDAAHQLRTPLAVLKLQVQSARRGDVEPAQALDEIGHTVDRATALANQMLALAKVEQLHQQALDEGHPVVDAARVVGDLALEMAPLMADRELAFELRTQPCPVRAHAWMLRELVRNLLHNAVRHSPRGAALTVTVEPLPSLGCASLCVADGGGGIAPAVRERLFEPFAAAAASGDVEGGSGLGLVIARQIADALGGTLALDDRPASAGRPAGLDARLQLPLAAPDAQPAPTVPPATA